ncbi:hypothetical protein [Jatrophihabitans fulvus]
MKRAVLVVVVVFVALATATTSASAPSPVHSVDIDGNHVATGALHLDLTGGEGTVDLAVSGLLPGGQSTQRFWVVANAPRSGVDATVSMAISDVRDVPAPCSTSHDKARAEQAAGITGCHVDGDRVSGTPERGVLSRMLSVTVAGRSVPSGAGCSDPAGPGAPVAAGTLDQLTGKRTPVRDVDGRDVRLAPGAGVCLDLSVRWPPDDGSSDRPRDNAAQGDAVTARVVFTLEQVVS